MPSGGMEVQAAEDDVDLRAYLTVLQRRWKVIVAITLLAVLAALALSTRQDSQYRAHADLLIRQSDSASIVGAGPVVQGNEAARRLNNEVELLESGTMRAAVARDYDGPLDPRDVDASVRSETADVVRIQVTAGSAEAAAELVNEYAATFIEVRRSRQITEMLAVGDEVREKAEEIDARIADLAGSSGTPDPDDAAEIAALEEQRASYLSQVQDLELSADIIGSSGAQVLTQAEVPSDPVSPNPQRDAAIALVLGLVLGVGVAFLVDTLDERIRNVNELEAISHGLPALGVIPLVEKGFTQDFMASRAYASSPQAEAVRSLRTAIRFSNLDAPPKVIQVTSASQGEGKTTTVANLATALAQTGERVAIVSCDLRRPSVELLLGIDLVPGLTDVLSDDITLDRAVRRYASNLVVLPGGTPPRNPSELLSSKRAAAVIAAIARDSDIVLLDCPPVLPVADALAVAHMADATLVVVDSRSTHRKALARTLQLLQQVRAPVIGTVLNGVSDNGGYGYGYGQSYEDARRDARRAPRSLEWAAMHAPPEDDPTRAPATVVMRDQPS